MSAPTPGPWTLREPVKATGDERMDWGISASIDGEPSLIAECFWRVGVQRYAPCHANARLIAAAPRMLDFVRGRACGSQNIDENGNHACVHHWDDAAREHECAVARAILRDVEGESNG